MALAKFMGRDCELSTTGIEGGDRSLGAWEVTRDILDHIGAIFEPRGLTAWTAEAAWKSSRADGWGSYGSYGSYGSAYSTDCLRSWLPSGQCAYADVSHVEVATAATLYPRTFAAQCFSMLLVAEAARERAEGEAREGTRYSLSASNADVLDPSISFGTHCSVAVTPELWEELFVDPKHPAILGFVASAMAAAIPFFGAGYILPLKNGPVFSLSARSHHISSISTSSTMEPFRRGLLNSRHEPHGEGHERLHLIGFDFNLISAALLCSFLQCCLAAAEEGLCDLLLYDPVRALRTWSWNIDLRTGKLPARAALVGGRSIALPAFIRELTKRFLKMCEARLIPEDVAPGAPDLLSRIVDLTHYAEEGSLVKAAKHLDWAAKLLSIMDLCKADGVKFGDAVTRLADHDFSGTHREALLWRLWEKGLVDPLIARGDVDRCLVDGPPEARGWARGRLLQKFSGEIAAVDWSHVELRRSANRWDSRLRIEMPHLDSLNRALFEPVIRLATSVAHLEELLKKNVCVQATDKDPVIDVRSQLEVPSENGGPMDSDALASPSEPQRNDGPEDIRS